jgi:hypothetical protein
MSGSVPSVLLYAFMACAGTAYRVSTHTVKRPEVNQDTNMRYLLFHKSEDLNYTSITPHA